MSQLQRDFEMYYTGSYVGIVNEDSGEVNPFYVERVSYDSAYGRGSTSNPEDVAGLVFQGQEILNERGQTAMRSVTGLNNSQLVLELPDLGYIKIRNSLRWITYKPNRTVKKGIVSRRLTTDTCNSRLAWAIYHQDISERISKDYIKRVLGDGTFLEYKNVIVGRFVSDTAIEIEPEMGNQLSRIQEENEGCQVTVKDQE